MTVRLPEFKLSYVAVPKVACTSIKSMFYEVENGAPFKQFIINGIPQWIHDVYPSHLFADLEHDKMVGHTRLTIVRDPLERLLSCYVNRVLYHKELSADLAGARLAQARLPIDPDLSTFVQNIAGYCRAVKSINHHARPLVDYLGRDAGWYDRIFRLAQLEDFRLAVSERLGREVYLERMQTSWRRFSTSELTTKDVIALSRFYAEDYRVFGRYF